MNDNNGNYEDIKKLKDLLDAGAITQDEFNQQKAKLLNETGNNRSQSTTNTYQPIPIKPKKKKGCLFVILGVVIIAIIIAMISSQNNNKGDAPSNSPDSSSSLSQSQSQSPSPNLKDDSFKDGTYLVNKDIKSGLYRCKITDTTLKMGYVERASDVTMGIEDILANIVLTGDGYVTIKDTDVAVKFQGVSVSPVDLATLVPDLKKELSDGMYLVGYDIKPGTYKVEITDTATQMGYVERLSDASMDFTNVIANDIFQGQGYVKILDGDFAIRVQGAKLTLQD